VKNLGWGIWLAVLLGCAGRDPVVITPGPHSCEDISKFFHGALEQYQDAMDEAGQEYQEEQWKVEMNDGGSADRLSRRFAEFQKIAYDQSILKATIQLADSTKHLKISDCPMRDKLNRVKGMLEATILTNPEVIRMEKENADRQEKLGSQSNGFRVTLPGEKEPVSRAIYAKRLGSEADRKNREALYRQFNPGRADKWVEWGFRDLLKARNAEAKAAGFNDYYEFRFFRNQLDFKNYRAMVKEIRTKLAPKVRAEIRRLGNKQKVQKVEDWDLRFIREQAVSGEINELLKTLPEKAVLEIAKDFWKGLGIDVDSYGFTMDLYPRPGKNTHAFAMAVIFPRVDEKGQVLKSPRPDIRFMANLKTPVTWDDISTVIHELGHAIHAAEVRQPLGIFRGFGSVDTEAIAMTAERMASSEEFYEMILPKYAQGDLKKLRPLLRRQVRAERAEQAIVLLRQVFFSDFEYELYRNPDANFGEVWAKLHKEYWGVAVDPKLAAWDIDHYVSSPVYIENYAIGMLMQEQIYELIVKDFKTSYKSVELGNRIRHDYFSPGQEYSYLDLVEKFTGRPLSARAALKLLD